MASKSNKITPNQSKFNSLQQHDLENFFNKKEQKNVHSHPEEELYVLAQSLIKEAKQKGADAVEININVGSGFNVSVRKGKLENIEQSQGKDLGIVVYFGNRTGSAIVSNPTPESVRLTLEKACYIAKFTHEDPCVGLADPALLAKDYPDLDLFHPWHLDAKKANDLAKLCEDYGFAYDKRIKNSEGASVSSSEVFSIYANSNNFLGSLNYSQHNFGLSLIAKQAKEMQRDYYFTVARDWQELETPKIVAKKAAERTISRLNARKISTRSCPIILHASVAKSLLGEFLEAINGVHLYHKATFLLDHLGQKIFPEHITIEEKPHILKALGSAPFDDEGVKLSHSLIVTNGILQRYILDSYSARKLKLKTTGNAGGIHNIFINTSNFNLKKLLKLMGKGVLVTELIGQGVNLITGDYSRGIFGFWVENGEIQYPIESATIAGNLKDMFLQIIAISNDIDHRSRILTGSILLDKMTVAGS